MAGPRSGVTRGILRSPFRWLAWIAGALAWAAAAAIGTVFALIVAATVVVISILGVVVLALTGAGIRARRSVRTPADPNVIEARNIGGHSWVAYGWDGRR
jgi:hypothetical protein